MKALVETTTNSILVDALTGDVVEWNRPSVVTWSSLLEARTGAGHLRVIHANLLDEATDQDFVDCLAACDGKVDLAIEAYLSEMAVDEAPGTKVEVPQVEVKVDKAPVTKLIGK